MILLSLWNQYSGQPAFAIAAIAGFVIGILGAIGIHEYAHAWMAHRLGDDTAKHLGRLTLNPFAHIDPLGLFLFIVAGFGFGKPVPYNTNALKNDTDEIKIAIAGPISNIITAFILALPVRIATAAGIDISNQPLFLFLDALISINIVLAAFNIIPIPPLDGSKILNYFLDEDAKMLWQRIGPILLLVLVFSEVIFPTASGISILSRVLNPIIHALNFVIRGTPQIL